MTDPPPLPELTVRLLVIAARDYDDEGDRFRAGIDAQIRVVADWFGAVAPGRTDVLLARDKDTATAFFREHVSGLTHRDALLVYLTGHGHRTGAGRFRLRLPDSDGGRLPVSGLDVAALLEELMYSDVENAMVLIDS